MIHQSRPLVDARGHEPPAVITTAALVSPNALALSLLPTGTRRVIDARARYTSRRLPSRRRRLLLVLVFGAVADVAVLGGAGVLVAQSSSVRRFLALVLIVAAAAVAAVLVALGRGSGRHCPGCPQ